MARMLITVSECYSSSVIKVQNMSKLRIIITHSKNKLQASMNTLFDPKNEMGASRINILASNYSTNITNNLVGGSFLTGLMLLLQADDLTIGLITIMIFVGNIFQLVSPLIIERFKRRKAFLIIGKTVIHFLNIIIISTISVLNITNQTRLFAIMLVLLIVNILSGIIAPGLSIWHIKSVPPNIRVKYFSFNNVASGVILYAAIMVFSRIADVFKSSGNEMLGLQILRVFAFIFALLDIYFMFRIKEFPYTKGESIRVVQLFTIPIKEKKFMISVLVVCLWTFTANFSGSFFNIYLLKDLNVQYSYLNLINMLNIPVVILFTPLWSGRIRENTLFKTLYICMGFFLTHYIILSFVNGSTIRYLYPISMVIGFIFAPGINIAVANIPYKNIPESNQTVYIGFYAAMINFIAFVSATLGREFIKYTEEISINFFGMIMQNKQFIMLISAALMLTAVFVIRLLHKKLNDESVHNDLDIQPTV